MGKGNSLTFCEGKNPGEIRDILTRSDAIKKEKLVNG